MQAKNKSTTASERDHIAEVKALPCSLCDKPGPSEAHHMDQDCAYTCIALCQDCHTGRNGWHQLKTYWRVKKWEEIDALGVTIKRLMAE